MHAFMIGAGWEQAKTQAEVCLFFLLLRHCRGAEKDIVSRLLVRDSREDEVGEYTGSRTQSWFGTGYELIIF